jgi:hypothetical protein
MGAAGAKAEAEPKRAAVAMAAVFIMVQLLLCLFHARCCDDDLRWFPWTRWCIARVKEVEVQDRVESHKLY